MKPDEKLLLAAVFIRWALGSDEFATDIGEALGMNHKRVNYLLLKWVRKRWWECGVSVRSGWLTEAGKDAVLKIIGVEN